MCDIATLNSLTNVIVTNLTITGRNLIVGIAGAQGSGKSTLALDLTRTLYNLGIRAVVVSLDDFYLPIQERNDLARLAHPLFRTRGVPGTHDIESLRNLLKDLRTPGSVKKDISWPKFSKARDERDKLENIYSSGDHSERLVIILEGWCVGCGPLNDIAIPINELEELEDPDMRWRMHIDNAIRTEYLPVWEMIDTYIFLRVPNRECILKWRAEQAVQNGEDLERLNIYRFFQFFERVSTQMLHDSGRLRADATVRLAPDHTVRDLQIVQKA